MKRTQLAAVALLSAAAPTFADSAAPYRIVADQKSDAGRIVEVRIEKRLDERELAGLVDAIVDAEPKAYARTTVNFLLPLSRPADGPWASATAVRNVAIKVPGLSADEERRYRAEAAADLREIVGSWLTSHPAPAGRLTLVRDRERMLLDWQTREGASLGREVTQTPVAGASRIDYLAGAADNFFILTADGGLEVHGRTGLIAVAERIPRAAPRPLASACFGATVQPWPGTTGDFITGSVVASSQPIGPEAGAAAPAALPPDADPAAKAQVKPSRKSTAASEDVAGKKSGIDVQKLFFSN